MNQLEQLKQRTTIDVDSGYINSIMAYQPEDATTNALTNKGVITETKFYFKFLVVV